MDQQEQPAPSEQPGRPAPLPALPYQTPASLQSGPYEKSDRRWSAGRIALLAAEALLVLVIIGLLLAIWMPAIIGAHPGS
jgi:hypothetical protein